MSDAIDAALIDDLLDMLIWNGRQFAGVGDQIEVQYKRAPHSHYSATLATVEQRHIDAAQQRLYRLGYRPRLSHEPSAFRRWIRKDDATALPTA